jgi:hypothetical protein
MGWRRRARVLPSFTARCERLLQRWPHGRAPSSIRSDPGRSDGRSSAEGAVSVRMLARAHKKGVRAMLSSLSPAERRRYAPRGLSRCTRARGVDYRRGVGSGAPRGCGRRGELFGALGAIAIFGPLLPTSSTSRLHPRPDETRWRRCVASAVLSPHPPRTRASARPRRAPHGPESWRAFSSVDRYPSRELVPPQPRRAPPSPLPASSSRPLARTQTSVSYTFSGASVRSAPLGARGRAAPGRGEVACSPRRVFNSGPCPARARLRAARPRPSCARAGGDLWHAANAREDGCTGPAPRAQSPS